MCILQYGEIFLSKLYSSLCVWVHLIGETMSSTDHLQLILQLTKAVTFTSF